MLDRVFFKASGAKHVSVPSNLKSSTPAIMVTPGEFKDYDDENWYWRSQEYARNPKTKNFVVDFGKDSAYIAFDTSAEDVKALLETPRDENRPIRWMYDHYPELLEVRKAKKSIAETSGRRTVKCR